MCPACMATVALIVASGTSAGGVTALVMKKLRRTRTKKAAPTRKACSPSTPSTAPHTYFHVRDDDQAGRPRNEV